MQVCALHKKQLTVLVHNYQYVIDEYYVGRFTDD